VIALHQSAVDGMQRARGEMVDIVGECELTSDITLASRTRRNVSTTAGRKCFGD
jgi:hypothetical protein